LWLAAAFVLYFTLPTAGISQPYWIVTPILMFWVFRVSRALKDPMMLALLLAAISAIALVGLICLLSLNVRATKVLKRGGIKVGLLGPNTRDLPQDDGGVA
jgi:hypothetical protein